MTTSDITWQKARLMFGKNTENNTQRCDLNCAIHYKYELEKIKARSQQLRFGKILLLK